MVENHRLLQITALQNEGAAKRDRLQVESPGDPGTPQIRPLGMHRPLRRLEQVPQHVGANSPIRTPTTHRLELDGRLLAFRGNLDGKVKTLAFRSVPQ